MTSQAFERGRMVAVRALRAAAGCWLLIAGATVLMFVGCTLKPAQAGDACQRSTECPSGLGCVRNRCTTDLGPVAAESTVPEIADETPPAGPAGDAAAVLPDASPADGG
jgi:hypothetical protein